MPVTFSQVQQDALQEQLLRRAILEQPPSANLEAATSAHDDGEIYFRGRRYRVPPVPHRRGLELRLLQDELSRASASEDPNTVAVIARLHLLVSEMLALMGTLIVWRWWQVRNPLLDAHGDEFRTLVDFFCSARTTCRVMARWSSRAPRWCRTTWPPSLPSSPRAIPAGWSPARPAAGGTIASDSSA